MTLSMKRLTVAILAATASTAYAEEQKHHFDIPAQSLGSALQSLAEQSGAPMLYAEQTAAGKQSRRLLGNYSTAEAADKLLAGSGLVHSVAANGTVTVKPAPQDAAPATLKPMTVTGKTGDDPRSYQAANTATATKTNTPIMKTPQSIQVIKRSLIDDQQNITVSESLRNVSGVVPNSPVFTPDKDFTLIRGFASEQLIDGFTQYYNPGDRESTVNIDRIEVLKGSNGILYSGGSGSPVGGLVSIVSKLPQAVASRELGFKIGTHNYYQPYVDINQPLTKNILARFTGEYTDSGSYLDNVKTQRYNLNPTITFTDNDATTFTVQGKVSRWDQPEYQGLPATGTVTGNFSIPRNTFIGPTNIPDSHSEFSGVWGTLDHKFNNIWSLNLKARHAQSEFDENVQTLFGADGFVADQPAFPPSTWFFTNAELSQKQEELSFLGNATAKFNAGPTENTLLIGADHSDFDDRGFMDVDFGPFGMGLGAVDLSAPSFSVPYSPAGAGIDNMFVKNTTYGGYTQLQSTLYDRFHLLTSVRVGHVGIDYENTSQGLTSSGEKTKVLPRAGGVFDITDEYSVFINYSEGMRGQPFVNFAGTPEPEESTTLEGGLKFNIAHQLTGQIAGYQIERSHVAVTDHTDPLRRSKAAGQQRSRGIETDLLWQATDALSILANFAHTDAEFTDNLAGVSAGNKLAMVPEDSGRLWVNYRFQQSMVKGLSIGGGVYAQGPAYLSNNNLYKSDGFHSFDASIAYERRHFRLAATVKNLTNEHYFQSYGYFGGRVIPSEGTSAFVTASVKF